MQLRDIDNQSVFKNIFLIKQIFTAE